MAVSVDWSSYPYLITIPQSDCTLVSGTRYQITVNEIWQLLRDFSDGPEGSARPITYRRIQSTSSTPAITEVNDPFYAAEFEDGLWSVDIIDGNSNFRDVEVKNQVSVGTNNTTGFINPIFLQHSTFDGAVWIDQASGSSGTTYPIGTPGRRCSNFSDGLLIAAEQGIAKFFVVGNATITENVSGFEIEGQGRTVTTITVDSAANVLDCVFEHVTITGDLDGNITIRDSEINGCSNFIGLLERCGINGLNTVGTSGTVRGLNCYAASDNVLMPARIDLGGASGADLFMGFSGVVMFLNTTSATQQIGLNVQGGQIILGATVDGGNFRYGGIGGISNNSTSTESMEGGLLNGTDLEEIHGLHGLDADNPITVTPTQRTFGAITQLITGDGETTSTVTRQ
jgi:hypothetical protein